MRKIIISPVNPVNIKDILEIEKKSFPSPWTASMFLEELSNPFSRSYFARWKDLQPTVLGYIFYQIVAFEIHILNIAVHPSFRNMGIGSTLLTNCLKKEKDSNSARYAILEVRENNVRAIDLYLKNGFKKVGLRKNYYRKEKTNAIIMGCPLD